MKGWETPWQHGGGDNINHRLLHSLSGTLVISGSHLSNTTLDSSVLEDHQILDA